MTGQISKNYSHDRQLSKQELIGVALDTLLQTNLLYRKMSGGSDIFNNGIENYISGKISEKLYIFTEEKFGISNDNYFILENDIRELIEYSGAQSEENVIEKGSGRVDILYWGESDKPTGIIELKRLFREGVFESDIVRIKELLVRCGGKNGTLRWGIVAGMQAYSNVEEERKIVTYVRNIEELLREPGISACANFKRGKIESSERSDDDWEEYVAFTVYFENENT